VTFANPLPWWALVLVVAGAGALAWYGYRYSALTSRQRHALAVLRFVTLLAIVLFLMRPVAPRVDADARDVVVPILVDTSRSMSIEDAGGKRRIDRARDIVDRLLPALASRFHVEILGFGEAVVPISPRELSATGRRSDLRGAISSILDRFRGRAVAGIVLISDGGDTGAPGERQVNSVPIFPIAVGSRTIGIDSEVLSLTAAEAVLDDSRIDLAVSAVGHGRGIKPIELRLLENGRTIEVRRAVPAAEGTPVREVFHVSPGRGTPTVYTVEIPAAAGEMVPENNLRSTLVQPPARTRRVLLVEGAPGFEHSFLKRAWSMDNGLEIDSVVRKGKNEQGHDTFYIQASRSRSEALREGYPAKAEDLFRYDAIVLANIGGHQLARAQLDATRAFVARRGGGLLVLGAQSFLQQGLADTPLEEVLPLELNDRGGGVLPASAARGLNRLSITADGEAHPMMQLAPDGAESRRRWEAVPALASIAPLGGPRPGARVLAVTSGAGGARRALVAVQRYGEGRAMVFTGEAAWRWRMLLPAADRSYDTFWRQAVRWLALPATDPIAITVPTGAAPGDMLPVHIDVRDAAFEPRRDASVDVRVTTPDGRLEQLRAALDSDPAATGRFVAHFRTDHPGVYRVTAEARRSANIIGSATASMLVGGADPEMTDPRLNQQALERLARASGGTLTSEDDIPALVEALQAAAPPAALAVRRDVWHTGWSFAAIIALLAAEWILRRRWGLR
jgi:uncharacterized membrane protein